MSGSITGRAPRTDAEWARDVSQRLKKLESPHAIRIGSWVLSARNGSIFASSPDQSFELGKTSEITETDLTPVLRGAGGVTQEYVDNQIEAQQHQAFYDFYEKLTGHPPTGAQQDSLDALSDYLRGKVTGNIDPSRLGEVPLGGITDTSPELLVAPEFSYPDAVSQDDDWIVDPSVGHSHAGSVRAVGDGTTKILVSNDTDVAVGQGFRLRVWVRYQDAAHNTNSTDVYTLSICEYHRVGDTRYLRRVKVIAHIDAPSGDSADQPDADAFGWRRLAGQYVVPDVVDVNNIRAQIKVSEDATAGVTHFDDGSLKHDADFKIDWVSNLDGTLTDHTNVVKGLSDTISYSQGVGAPPDPDYADSNVHDALNNVKGTNVRTGLAGAANMDDAVRGIDGTVTRHGTTLGEHGQTIDQQGQTLGEHGQTIDQHGGAIATNEGKHAGLVATIKEALKENGVPPTQYYVQQVWEVLKAIPGGQVTTSLSGASSLDDAVNTVSSTAEGAQAAASTAQDTAEGAQSTAEGAQSTAEGAQSAADTNTDKHVGLVDTISQALKQNGIAPDNYFVQAVWDVLKAIPGTQVLTSIAGKLSMDDAVSDHDVKIGEHGGAIATNEGKHAGLVNTIIEGLKAQGIPPDDIEQAVWDVLKAIPGTQVTTSASGATSMDDAVNNVQSTAEGAASAASAAQSDASAAQSDASDAQQTADTNTAKHTGLVNTIQQALLTSGIPPQDNYVAIIWDVLKAIPGTQVTSSLSGSSSMDDAVNTVSGTAEGAASTASDAASAASTAQSTAQDAQSTATGAQQTADTNTDKHTGLVETIQQALLANGIQPTENYVAEVWNVLKAIPGTQVTSSLSGASSLDDAVSGINTTVDTHDGQIEAHDTDITTNENKRVGLSQTIANALGYGPAPNEYRDDNVADGLNNIPGNQVLSTIADNMDVGVTDILRGFLGVVNGSPSTSTNASDFNLGTQRLLNAIGQGAGGSAQNASADDVQDALAGVRFTVADLQSRVNSITVVDLPGGDKYADFAVGDHASGWGPNWTVTGDGSVKMEGGAFKWTGDADESVHAVYTAGETVTDTQEVSLQFLGIPAPDGAARPTSNMLIARSNASADTFVFAEISANKAILGYYRNGARTVWTTQSTSAFSLATWILHAGSKNDDYEFNLYQANDLIVSYTDTSHDSALGGGYRYGGQGMHQGSADSPPAWIRTWKLRDAAPTKISGTAVSVQGNNNFSYVISPINNDYYYTPKKIFTKAADLNQVNVDYKSTNIEVLTGPTAGGSSKYAGDDLIWFDVAEAGVYTLSVSIGLNAVKPYYYLGPSVALGYRLNNADPYFGTNVIQYHEFVPTDAGGVLVQQHAIHDSFTFFANEGVNIYPLIAVHGYTGAKLRIGSSDTAPVRYGTWMTLTGVPSGESAQAGG